MQPANPQPQPAADESANAVTEIAARVEAAKTELQSIIDTKWHGSPCTAFRMRIPAQETDSDIVIGNALSGLDTLLAALTREREALAAMTTRAQAAEAGQPSASYGQSAVSFVVCRAATYEGDVYTPEELTGVNYIVFISNGDSHLLNTVAEVEALLSDELFLHGYNDPDNIEAASADEPNAEER